MNQTILIRLEKEAEKMVLQIPASLESEEFTWLFNEKFAELIVRECADIATINTHQWETPGTYVLKHFGVEE
jgi:hypothetical protein